MRKIKQACQATIFLMLLCSDPLSLPWSPSSSTVAFPSDHLTCQCLKTTGPQIRFVFTGAFKTLSNTGATSTIPQAGCLLLWTKHAAKHSREETYPMEPLLVLVLLPLRLRWAPGGALCGWYLAEVVVRKCLTRQWMARMGGNVGLLECWDPSCLGNLPLPPMGNAKVKAGRRERLSLRRVSAPQSGSLKKL